MPTPDDYQYELLQCALRIEKLMDFLLSRNETVHPRRQTATLEPAVQEIYTRYGAALFLNKSEKQVYRYRISGQLSYFRDPRGNIRYRQKDLEVLFLKIWGFPKHD